jgi:transposase
MLVRSRIFEGNRADCKTLQQMIGSLEGSTTCDTHRKIIVMDAGISTKENLDWLKAHHYEYITVMRSAGVKYTTIDNTRKTVTDNKGQQIELQKVRVEGLSDTVLLVDSELKTRKEQSMYRRACGVYEEGLKAIESGIYRKGGTKKRDAVNLRLGRLKERSYGVHNDYEVTFEYDEKDITRAMSWKKKEARSQLTESSHGTYLIATNMDENEEENIWQFYNVIRTVEETFRILKTDLDIRPVYHKTDEGIKAHLHLAILAYWVVSSVQYQLKKKGIGHQWNELVRVMKTQVVVTTRATQNDGARVEIRQCTEPEEKLNQILTALDIKTPLIKRKKFVWHPKAPPQKNIHSLTGT